MSKLLKRTRNIYKQIPEPSSINSNPMVKEGKFLALLAVPLISLLGGVLAYARYFAVTSEDFMLVSILGLTLWGVGIAGVMFYYQMEANKFILFDREFGFTPRLRPRDEIYCKPEDIRELIGPEDYIQDYEQFKHKVQVLGLKTELETELLNNFSDQTKPKKYLYYFRHKDEFEGWNAAEHTMPLFQSHAVFIDKPFRETFEFGAGQENWFGPILYNHTHSESDNVKVIMWGTDPFTDAAMPVCMLIHSSKAYEEKQKQPDNDDFEMLDAQQTLITYLHGLTENYRKELSNLQSQQNAKYHDVNDISKHGHQIARVDMQLFLDIMKPVSRGLLKSTMAKVLVTIAIIAAIVFLVCYVLGWVNLNGIFGGAPQQEGVSFTVFLKTLLRGGVGGD